jgi:hypothetical protein
MTSKTERRAAEVAMVIEARPEAMASRLSAPLGLRPTLKPRPLLIMSDHHSKMAWP